MAKTELGSADDGGGGSLTHLPLHLPLTGDALAAAAAAATAAAAGGGGGSLTHLPLPFTGGASAAAAAAGGGVGGSLPLLFTGGALAAAAAPIGAPESSSRILNGRQNPNAITATKSQLRFVGASIREESIPLKCTYKIMHIGKGLIYQPQQHR